MTQKRSIFEEVGAESAPVASPSPGGISREKGDARRWIRAWLWGLLALVAAMMVIGGLTRLTESASPGMDLMGVDLDSVHQWLGRATALYWAVGFIAFLATRRIPAGYTRPLLIMGGLIGVQIVVGNWLSTSGVTQSGIDVVPYRLAIHLGLTFFLYALILWTLFKLGRSSAQNLAARRLKDRALWGMTTGLLHLTGLQIVLGALVAGLDGGRSFAEWPLMGGQFFPPSAFDLEPFWRNFFENAGLVQFIHRIVGYLCALLAIGVLMRGRKSANSATRTAAYAAVFMVFLQAVVGIVTVLQAAHLHIALTHQVGALLTITVILLARFRAGYPTEQKVSAA
ncbi:MAG: heme A synthase [Rhodobacterales bacterium]|nr:MAG: heme A synthase [Rhodobacterales bacterium]